MEKGITVFTPIYNRAYCIERLYNSLKRQTYKNFEWIVVDDGSDDNVAQLFDRWVQEEINFNIIYVKTKNGGKMKAVNKGVKLAEAPAFFIADSDDYITDDALELLDIWFKEIKDDNSFAGVSGLRKIRTIDAKYEFDFVDATNLERRKNHLAIDMAECYKTEILKKYKAPEIEGENYISPSIVWNKIAKDGYKLRWHNRVIYIGEYQPDGLSAAGPNLLVKNPIGWAQVIQLNILCKKDKEYEEFQYYRYIKSLKDKLPLEIIAKYLGLNKQRVEEITQNKPTIIDRLNVFFAKNKIESVALYGVGGEAKRFLQIIDDLNIEICYGIDRKPNNILSVCYKPTDKLPVVDAILITNRMGIEEIKTMLNSYTDMRIISIQNDILEKSLNYYFSDI